MQLSEHFSLEELTHTSTGLKNTPNETELNNLKRLCNEILEPIRNKLGKPICVSSGYRCKQVNSSVGGATNSDHLFGRAADIYAKDNRELWNCIVDLINNDGLRFGQLIYEFGNDNAPAWIHISTPTEKHDEEVMRATKNQKGRTEYQYIII